MKYPPLEGVCKDCTGCTRLENPSFKGVYQCNWNKQEFEKKEIKWVQERIKL